MSDGSLDHFTDMATFRLVAAKLEVILGHEPFALDAGSAIKDSQLVTTP